MSGPRRTGGIRPRLARLTSPDMKQFISDAVAANKRAADKKPGDKLLAELNKQWTVVLKSQKKYDAMVAEIDQAMKGISGKDIEDAAFDKVQAAINATKRPLAEIALDLAKFEQAEKKLVDLLKVKAVPGGP